MTLGRDSIVVMGVPGSGKSPVVRGPREAA
jgi:adenylate kinase